MNKNKTYFLEDLLTLKYGKDQKKVIDPLGQFPILGTGGIIGYSNTFLYDKPSVLIGRKGTIDKVSFIDVPFWTIDTLFYSEINEELTIPKWLYYRLSLIDFSRYNEATGVPSLKTTTLNKIPITICSLHDQQKIASVLSALDDQIELNNKINQELEDFAQTLYNYWFVQFEFPNEDGKPYKSSGGKMVWSEELKREIPEGWHIKNLGSLISKKRVKIASKENWANEKLIDLANMPSFSMCLNMYELGEKLNTNIFKMDKFDILFGSIRPYLGKAGFAPFDGVLAGTIYSFTTNNDEDYGFILNTVTRKEFFDYAVTRSKGTKMPVIDFDVIEDYTVVIPTNKSLLIRYNEVIMSFIETISNNICCSQELTQLRDDLLPLLMNGQVVISDFDTE